MTDNPSRNPSPPPISESELEKIQEDFIKDTVFSKRWVLDVLLKLFKHDDSIYSTEERDDEKRTGVSIDDKVLEKELDEDFENDLCQFWDMTANNEVALFLNEHECKDALLHALHVTQSPRLMEICFGIIGNLFCVKEILVSYSQSQDFRMKLLRYLKVTDALSLVELTRLLNTALSCSTISNLWLMDLCDAENGFVKQLAYILGNSLNVDLVVHVIEILDIVFDFEDKCIDTVVGEILLGDMLEALKFIRKNGKSKCMVTLAHIMQTISTSEKGLTALQKNSAKLIEFIELCALMFSYEDSHEAYSGTQFLFYASILSCVSAVFESSTGDIMKFLKDNREFLSSFINFLKNHLLELRDDEEVTPTSHSIAYIGICVKCFYHILTLISNADMKHYVDKFAAPISQIATLIKEIEAFAEIKDDAAAISNLLIQYFNFSPGRLLEGPECITDSSLSGDS